jgi:hypothetical protein
MGRASRDVWAKRVERWRDSGLGVRQYAEQAGLNADRLRHWSWRLSKAGASLPVEASQTSSPPTPLPFVEVTSRAAAVTTSDVSEDLHIVVPSGVRIVVPPRFDEGALRRVLAVVR